GLVDRLNREYQLDEAARRAGIRPLTPTVVLEHRDGQAPTLYGLAQCLMAEYAPAFGIPVRPEARDDNALQALLRRLLRSQLAALGLPLNGERPVRLPAFYDRWFEASRTYIAGLTADAEDPWAVWERHKDAWLAEPAMQGMVVLLETALRAL